MLIRMSLCIFSKGVLYIKTVSFLALDPLLCSLRDTVDNWLGMKHYRRIIQKFNQSEILLASVNRNQMRQKRVQWNFNTLTLTIEKEDVKSWCARSDRQPVQ